MAYLQIRDVVKTFANVRVLDHVSLDVRRGEIMALVGPSGSGKTTLLRCINRLTEMDSGHITLDGHSILDMEPTDLRRRVGMVFQEGVMLSGTVYDNIVYGLRLQGKNRDVSGVLKEVGLGPEYMSKDAEKLSGGEKQRVALARVLILEPEVLLLDEPTASMDPKIGRRIEGMIRALSKRHRLTVLWVTHDVSQAKRVGDRIAGLKSGRVWSVAKRTAFRWGEAY